MAQPDTGDNGTKVQPTEAAAEALISADLVARIVAGDGDAEASLVSRYSTGILFFLKRRNGPADYNQDILQDIMMIVLQKVRQGKVGEPQRLAAYIQRVARNVAIAHYRKRSRSRENGTHGEFPAPRHKSPQSALERRQEGLLVKQIIEQMTERDRQVLFRFYLEEEDKQTILAELGLSSLNFNRVLYRARKRFAELWRQQKQRALTVLLYLFTPLFGKPPGVFNEP